METVVGQFDRGQGRHARGPARPSISRPGCPGRPRAAVPLPARYPTRDEFPFPGSRPRPNRLPPSSPASPRGSSGSGVRRHRSGAPGRTGCGPVWGRSGPVRTKLRKDLQPFISPLAMSQAVSLSNSKVANSDFCRPGRPSPPSQPPINGTLLGGWDGGEGRLQDFKIRLSLSGPWARRRELFLCPPLRAPARNRGFPFARNGASLDE